MPFEFQNENFIDLGIKPRLGRKSVLDAQIGLLTLSAEVDVSTYLYVQDIAQFAERTMKEVIPVGDTENLRNSVTRYIFPVKEGRTVGGQFTGEGPWVSRVYINPRTIGFPRPQAPGALMKSHTDRPIQYALAVNDGRRSLSPDRYGKTFFGWYDPRKPLLEKKNGSLKRKYGYNVFTKHLKPRSGVHFIETTNQLTDAYAAEKTRTFLRGKGRSTVATRSRLREDLGFPVAGDF